MSVGKSTGLKRLVIAIVCAAVFVCLGGFVVKKWLPQEVQITQYLTFESPTASAESWKAFLRQEKRTVVYLVRQNPVDWPISIEQVLKKLSIHADHSPPALTITLRSNIHLDLQTSLQKLIDDYVENRVKTEKISLPFSPESSRRFFAETSGKSIDLTYRSVLLEQLKRQYDREEALTQQCTDLKLKHNRLEIETVAMEQELGGSGKNQSVGFNEYLKPFSEKIFDSDAYLRQLRRLLEQNRRQRDRLDIQAGQTILPRPLSDLEDQLNKLFLQGVSLEEKMAVRQQQSLERMRRRLWPKYRKELDLKVRRNHQLLAGLRSRKQVVTESLKQVKKIIASFQSDLTTNSDGSDSLPQPALDAQAGFHPQLLRPVPPLLRQVRFGRWRIGGLLVLAVFGGLIGAVVSGAAVPAPAPAKKTRVDPKEKGENWLEENPEPLEPVVISRPQTNPITQSLSEKRKKKIRPKKEARKKLKINLDEPPAKPPLSESPDSPPAEDSVQNFVEEVAEELPAETALAPDESTSIAETAAIQGNGFNPDAEPGTMEQCEPYADRIESLRLSTPCPFIVVSALSAADTSPRFIADLAIVLQRRHQRVLLIEADQASTVLAEKVFEFQTTPGFYQWRRGDAWVSQVSCETHLRDITFMSAGTADENQCDQDLDLTREAHRWSNLKTRFDVVLLFCPSALSQKSKPSHHLAAAHLLDLADGIFVLTKSKNTEKIEEKVQGILTDKKIQLLDLISMKK